MTITVEQDFAWARTELVTGSVFMSCTARAQGSQLIMHDLFEHGY